MTQEQKEKNLALFLKKVSSLGIDTTLLNEKYGECLMNATFTNSNEHGQAYEGSLLEIVLKTLTPYAIKLNDALPEAIRVDKATLVKVCLLHQIAKAVRLVANDNQWEIEKRGLVFKYDDTLPSIRTGLHSLVMATECGIPFTAEETEAMTVNDRELTDQQARFHSSVMSTIVRMANELTYTELNA
jgi:hypothetical protein